MASFCIHNFALFSGHKKLENLPCFFLAHYFFFFDINLFVNISHTMDLAKAAVLQKTTLFFESTDADKQSQVVKGFDFNKVLDPNETPTTSKLDYDALLTSMKNYGFQGTNFGKAVEEINKMVHLMIDFSNF
jgi:hypothetical protein